MDCIQTILVSHIFLLHSFNAFDTFSIYFKFSIRLILFCFKIHITFNPQTLFAFFLDLTLLKKLQLSIGFSFIAFRLNFRQSPSVHQVSISPTFYTQLFVYKSIVHNFFLCLHFRLELFWHKYFGTKCLIKCW
jgi:hypothetical protein